MPAKPEINAKQQIVLPTKLWQAPHESMIEVSWHEDRRESGLVRTFMDLIAS
jgi:hypothetical protein